MYRLKLKQFREVLSALFVLLSYLEKNIAFKNYPIQYKFFAYEIEQDSRTERKSLLEEK
jgi:hypothetical protein